VPRKHPPDLEVYKQIAELLRVAIATGVLQPG
jgi:DNA-binding transcriptional regulator YhcF (GntR family)